MKRLFACLVFGLALIRVAPAATIPVYSTPVTSPPQAVPVVDATNFFMNGVFSVTVSNAFDIAGYTYDFSNVENFTNRNTVSVFPGVRFDTVPSSNGERHSAKNFVNANNVNTNFNSTTVGGGFIVWIDATNIINRGSLSTFDNGLIRVTGETVDVSRGAMAVGTIGGGGAFDPIYWGYSTNLFDPGGANLSPTAPLVPIHTIIDRSGFTNTGFTFPTDAAGTQVPLSGSGLQAFVRTATLGTNTSVQIVYVRTSDLSLPVSVYSTGQGADSNGIVTIEWGVAATNLFGQVVTNYLSLVDDYGLRTTNFFNTNFLFFPATLQPENFTLTTGTFSQLKGTPMAKYITRLADSFFGTNSPPTPLSNNVASFGVRILGTASDPAQGSPQLSFNDNVRALPGRVEITGSKVLNLNLARVQSQAYMLLSATNHFAGSSNAVISTTYADIRLGSTNGNLVATSVIQPTIPQISGRLDIYSGAWTSSDLAAGTNQASGHYNVIYVDANLNSSTPSTVLDLDLHSRLGTNQGNVVVGDVFNVTGRLLVDAAGLTVAANGVLNLNGVENADDGNWSSGIPYLQSFTNLGTIFSPSFTTLNFFGPGQAPDGSDLSYVNFINQGLILGAGLIIKADDLENRGSIQAGQDGISIQAGTLTIESTPPFGGQFIALNSDINVTCLNLNISNQTTFPSFWPGHSLFLSVSNNVNINSNFWVVSDGFNLSVKPLTGDFNLVTITNIAVDFANPVSTWAGADLGQSAAGFVNNAALGRLILDGAPNSAFTFADLQDGDLVTNALYVDVLVLRNNATNLSGSTLANIYVQPEMKLYYSRLFFDTTEVTGLVGGVSGGGGFFQVTHNGAINTASMPGPGGSGGITLANVNLTVSVLDSSTAHLSWNTQAGGVNYVYYRSTQANDSWHLLTKFTSGITGVVSIDDNPGTGTRLYKVRVDLPTQ